MSKFFSTDVKAQLQHTLNSGLSKLPAEINTLVTSTFSSSVSSSNPTSGSSSVHASTSTPFPSHSFNSYQQFPTPSPSAAAPQAHPHPTYYPYVAATPPNPTSASISAPPASNSNPDAPVLVYEWKKYDKEGSQIIDAATNTVLYTKNVVKKHFFTEHHDIGIYRGGSSAMGSLRNPYATIEKDVIKFDETVPPPYTGVKDYPESDFLYKRKSDKDQCVFMYGPQEYRLQFASRKSYDVQLLTSAPNDPRPSILLAVFTLDIAKYVVLAGKAKGRVQIFPAAVQQQQEHYHPYGSFKPGHSVNPHALVVNGQPTQLFDLAVVAEHHFRALHVKKVGDKTGEVLEGVGEILGAM